MESRKSCNRLSSLRSLPIKSHLFGGMPVFCSRKVKSSYILLYSSSTFLRRQRADAETRLSDSLNGKMALGSSESHPCAAFAAFGRGESRQYDQLSLRIALTRSSRCFILSLGPSQKRPCLPLTSLSILTAVPPAAFQPNRLSE